MVLLSGLSASILDFVRASKSPHLVVSVIGVVSIIYGSKIINSDTRYWWVAIPIFVTLSLITLFSFKDNLTDENDEGIENHFRFSRAMGVGTAIIAMVLTGFLNNKEPDHVFYIGYFVAIIQLVTFIVYSAIRLFKEESEAKLHIFQISFIMFVFLIAFIYSYNASSNIKDVKIWNRYMVSAVVFGLLWLIYEVFWVRRILQIVEFRVREDSEVESGK